MKRAATIALPLAVIAGCSTSTHSNPNQTVTQTVTASTSSSTPSPTTTADTQTSDPTPTSPPQTQTSEDSPSTIQTPTTDAPVEPSSDSSLTSATEESTPADTGQDSGSGSVDAAARAARNYLETSAFSKQGLIDQLSSEYGEKFSVADATAAVNSLTDVNWNEQAAKSAQSYLDSSPMSCAALKEQLSSPYGEKFTPAQAAYGANQTSVCK